MAHKAGDSTKRGEVHWADLRGCEGHEEGKRRPDFVVIGRQYERNLN